MIEVRTEKKNVTEQTSCRFALEYELRSLLDSGEKMSDVKFQTAVYVYLHSIH